MTSVKVLRMLAVMLASTLFTSLYAADGDVFIPDFSAGPIVTYEVISESEKTCQVIRSSSFALENGINDTGSLTIPSTVNGYTVVAIGENAFSNYKFTSVKIPSSVKSIGRYSFSYCTGISSIVLPEGLISIGYGSFNMCTGLQSVTIPTTLEKTEVFAFRQCKALSAVYISDLKKWCGIDFQIDQPLSLAHHLYINGELITGELVIPEGVTEIKELSFGYDYDITSVIIPNGVTSINDGAFSVCLKLAEITIPSTVTNINEGAFFGSNSLATVKVMAKDPIAINNNTFPNRANATLYVPKGSKTVYEEADYWKEFKDIVEFEVSCTLNISSVGNGTAKFNNTTVRNKTEVFMLSGGSNATIDIMPDTGYRIASVKVNDKDVTSNIANNKYTISNITANTTFAVVFEPIRTHLLAITASGNGSAVYNGTSVRGKTQTFTVTEGTTATLTFTPDTGYRITSVKLNGIDVTANVANNKYTISNITANTTLAVTFEAIPPTTYSMSITAIGNGIATYNNTAIRGKTQTFTVTEGTSATITFTPDAGYRIKSVRLNNADVTSSVTNSQYTISNIKSDNTLTVEFEAIPPSVYTMNIVAVGSGSVSYNNTTIRNQSKEFSVTEKSSVTITMSPDNGYRVASVKVNSVDVTNGVQDNQYTISNIAQNTNVEVAFEEIPPTTYSLTITAIGNGKVTYDNQDIRGGSSTFTIVEGSYATIQIAADEGYRLKSVTLDGKDVTADVTTNNQYTTAKILGNTKLVVEFEEDIVELAQNGVNYRVTSQEQLTANVTKGSYGLTLTIPAAFEAKGKTWTVVGIDDDALADATELAAIDWQPAVLFTAQVSNPNLLLYVKGNEYAPATIQNVVVNGQADNIILTDAASGNNFYCPKAFTARRISYVHHYSMTTGLNTCQGWETIALPFDVTTVLNQKGVELLPYAAWQQGSNLRPFWLYQLTSNGWQTATAIQGNTPYIISMPNHEEYQQSYIQSGYIQYIGNNVEVKASSQLIDSQYGKRHLVANYQQQNEGADLYALNVNNLWSQNTDATQAEGSTFIRNSRAVHPFEAYMTLEGSTAAPRAIPLFVEETTGIGGEFRVESGERATAADGWYDLQGRKLQSEPKPKQKGIYIRNGKKVKY